MWCVCVCVCVSVCDGWWSGGGGSDVWVGGWVGVGVTGGGGGQVRGHHSLSFVNIAKQIALQTDVVSKIHATRHACDGWRLSCVTLETDDVSHC
jgi:hypothetical protein